MFSSLPARWLAVFPAMAALAATAFAQAPGGADYRSAFDGYRPFTDEKPIPWKQANETVHRRGGWQAYAKEAAESESPKAPEDAPASAPPAPSHQGHQGHQGHSMPAQPRKEQP